MGMGTCGRPPPVLLLLLCMLLLPPLLPSMLLGTLLLLLLLLPGVVLSGAPLPLGVLLLSALLGVKNSMASAGRYTLRAVDLPLCREGCRYVVI